MSSRIGGSADRSVSRKKCFGLNWPTVDKPVIADRDNQPVHPADVADRIMKEIAGCDSIIEFSEPIQPRVPVREYDAIILSVNRVILPNWRRGSLFFRFQLREVGPAHGVILPGYLNLAGNEDETKHSRKKAVQLKKPSGKSKLARWWRILLEFDPTLNLKAVDLRAFPRYLYRVAVVDVEKDHDQLPVVAAGQYQIVSQITAVIGKLGVSR